jgi:hypothetical protein
MYAEQQSVAFQKTVIFIVTLVKTWSLAKYQIDCILTVNTCKCILLNVNTIVLPIYKCLNSLDWSPRYIHRGKNHTGGNNLTCKRRLFYPHKDQWLLARLHMTCWTLKTLCFAHSILFHVILTVNGKYLLKEHCLINL